MSAGNDEQPMRRGLRARAVGVVPISFTSLATISPAASIFGGIILIAPYSKGSTPFAVLLGLLACLMVAISIGQLARHLSSAGGLYTYNVEGLGRHIGFLVGWLYELAYALLPCLGGLTFGYALGSYLHHNLGFPSDMWIPLTASVGLLAVALAYRGIRPASYVLVLLGIFEAAIFVAIAVTMVVKAGHHNTASVFVPKGKGVFAAMIFIVLNFIGFESAVSLAEESKLPRKTIPRAVVGSCIASGAFFLLCYYAATVFFGPHRFGGAAFVKLGGASPWAGLAGTALGSIAIISWLAIWSSQGSSVNASVNSGSRIFYALSRANLMPTVFGRVHRAHQTPSVAILGLGTFALALSMGLAAATGSPLTAFALVGATLSLLLIVVYIGTCASCIAFYRRRRPHEFNPFLHLICPTIGIGVFIPVLVASLGIDFAGLGITPLHYPVSLAPWIVLGWVALGIVYLVYLGRRRPHAIGAIGRAFGATEVSDEPAAQPQVLA